MRVSPPGSVCKQIGTGLQGSQRRCLNGHFTRYKLGGSEQRTGTRRKAGNAGERNVCVCTCVHVCACEEAGEIDFFLGLQENTEKTSQWTS